MSVNSLQLQRDPKLLVRKNGFGSLVIASGDITKDISSFNNAHSLLSGKLGKYALASDEKFKATFNPEYNFSTLKIVKSEQTAGSSFQQPKKEQGHVPDPPHFKNRVPSTITRGDGTL